MKKLVSILLSVVLVMGMTVPSAAAADKATGTTLRLESAEGTVSITNSSGLDRKYTKGMKLYSGNTLETEVNSYAYVSLDSSKVVKLGSLSQAEVNKSGKKLELKLTSGELFFNVEKPLEKDESLNIRTSTMVTGIRGTVGYVKVHDRYNSEIALLEGKLTITSHEPVSGGTTTVVLTAGQKATATVTKPDEPTSPVTLKVEPLKEAAVPGFVAVEVAKSPEIQARIEEKSPLAVPEIIRDVDTRLKAEETAAAL